MSNNTNFYTKKGGQIMVKTTISLPIQHHNFLKEYSQKNNLTFSLVIQKFITNFQKKQAVKSLF